MSDDSRPSAGMQSRRGPWRRSMRRLEDRAHPFREASVVIIALGLLAYVLALVGFSRATNPTLDWPDRIYRSLQVFGLGLANLDPALSNGYIEIARFIGVAVTIGSVVLGFAFVVSQRLRSLASS